MNIYGQHGSEVTVENGGRPALFVCSINLCFMAWLCRNMYSYGVVVAREVAMRATTEDCAICEALKRRVEA